MKIAIIGGAGYIGSFLYKHLSSNHNVTVYDMNNRFDHVRQLRGSNISKEELQHYEIVIYLAGISGRIGCIEHTQEDVWKENIEDIMCLGKKMDKNQLLIYASSASVLEGSKNIVADEDYTIKTEVLDKYSLSMYEREQHVKTLEVPTIGLRFGTIIGISPVQRNDLVHIAMVRAAYLNGRINIQNPRCYRAILWNHDMLYGIEAIISKKKYQIGHTVFNMSSYNTNVGKIANNINQRLKIPIVIDCDNDVSGFSLNNTRFQKTYGCEFIGTCDKIITELIENIGILLIDKIIIDNQCRVCKGNNMTTVMDMGFQPLANNYVEKPIKQALYPLCLIRCKGCMHTQLNYTVRPEVLFKNYQYVSGTSSTMRKYFASLVQKCIRDTGYTKGNVLEIACNDGSQLDEFLKVGWNTYGVDPAQNVVIEGHQKGHQVYCGFWGIEDFPDIPTPDIIIAQNVVAHVPDPISFMKHCSRVMKDHTNLYIQTSQCNMYYNSEFDTIYHEHLSFFTIASMLKAAEICGLVVEEITKQPVHGTSYLFRILLCTKDRPYHSIQSMNMLLEEKNIGLYTDLFYENYKRHVSEIKKWVLFKIMNFRNKNISLVGYGAAAKGITLLHYFDIHVIEYIVDDAVIKQNKYTPGNNIPIIPPNHLKKDERTLAVFVFAWNFIDEILEKIKTLRKGLETYVIQPFPVQTIYHVSKTSHVSRINGNDPLMDL